MRSELKLVKKEAATQVAAFSEQIAGLNDEAAAAKARALELQAALTKKLHESNEQQLGYRTLEGRIEAMAKSHAAEVAKIMEDADKFENEASNLRISKKDVEARLEKAKEDLKLQEAQMKRLRKTIKERDKGLQVAEKVGHDTQLRLEKKSSTRLLKVEIARRREDAQGIADKLAAADTDKVSLRREARLAQSKLEKEIAELKAELEASNATIAQEKKMYAETRSKLSSVQEAANKTINQLMDDVKAAEEKHMKETSSYKRELKDQHNLFLDLQNEHETSVRRAAHSNSKAESEIEKLQNRLDAMIGAKDDYVRKLQSKERECEGMLQDIEEYKENVDRSRETSICCRKIRESRKRARERAQRAIEVQT